MNSTWTALAPLLQLAALVLLAPAFGAAVARGEARLLGAAGPPILSCWRRLVRTWRQRPPGRPASATADAAAALALAAALAAAGLVPAGTAVPPPGASGGLVAFAALCALARVSALAAALAGGDTVAARAVPVAALAEALAAPALLVALLALALGAASAELGDVVRAGTPGALAPFSPARLLAGAALVLLALIATAGGALPRAHTSALPSGPLALLRGAGGPRLAILELGQRLREILLWALAASALLPWGLAPGAAPAELAVGLAALAVKLALAAAAAAALRAGAARLRLARDAELAGVALALAALALVFAQTGVRA